LRFEEQVSDAALVPSDGDNWALCRPAAKRLELTGNWPADFECPRSTSGLSSVDHQINVNWETTPNLERSFVPYAPLQVIGRRDIEALIRKRPANFCPVTSIV
jgi:hypothetical protein